MSGSGSNPLDGSSSSSDGGGGGIALPKWLPTSFEGFRNLVLGVVSSAVVGWIIGAGESVVASLLTVWDTVISIGGTVGSWFEGIGSAVGSIPTGAIALAEEIVLELASSTGPFAPLVVVIAWGVLIVGIAVGIRISVGLIRALVGVLPFT